MALTPLQAKRKPACLSRSQPNANGRLSAVSVFRLGCRYEPTFWRLEGLSFAFTCDNLFDESYCDYAVASVTSGKNAYYPAAGRSLLFTVRYEF